MTSSLQNYVDGWSPGTLTERDRLDGRRAGWLADILDAGDLLADGTLPPSWQWAYFADWPPHASLNPDGHPGDGPFQPPIPERRRMWAGGSLECLAPLRLDVDVERRASLLHATPKSGRTGEMVLVGVRYDYLQDGELCLRETQNHVYRSGADSGPARTWPERPSAPPQSDADWRHDIVTDPIRLFRFSAITGNSHRIHYDLPYATGVEGYRDLVVHGPLLAQQLAVLGRRDDPARALATFDYRLQQPVFVGDPVAAVGRLDGDAADLQVVSEGGTVHVTATATYRHGA